MVFCIGPVDEFRSSFETAMKQNLQFHCVLAETSKRHLPITLNQTLTTEYERAQLIESLHQKGFNKLTLLIPKLII
jgi:hypothetical protein